MHVVSLPFPIITRTMTRIACLPLSTASGENRSYCFGVTATEPQFSPAAEPSLHTKVYGTRHGRLVLHEDLTASMVARFHGKRFRRKTRTNRTRGKNKYKYIRTVSRVRLEFENRPFYYAQTLFTRTNKMAKVFRRIPLKLNFENVSNKILKKNNYTFFIRRH